MNYTLDIEKMSNKAIYQTYLVAKHQINHEGRFPCFNCKEEAMTYNKEENTCSCSACGQVFSLRDLIERDTDGKAKNRTEQERYLKETFAKAIFLQDVADTRTKGEAFFVARGISAETLKPFDIRFNGEYQTQDKKSFGRDVWSVAQIRNGGTLTAYNTDETADIKNRRRGQESYLFNAGALAEKVVFVVSDELDCLSILEAGVSAVAIGNNGGELIHAIKSQDRKPVLLLALQDKEEEQELSAELKKEEITAFASGAVFLGKGTINEALRADPQGFGAFVKEIADTAPETEEKQYAAETSGSAYIKALKAEIEESKNRPIMKTGFPALDGKLDGGLYSGLYIIGGNTGTGKTTFVLQIADSLAKQGFNVLIFSLEMAGIELVGKSVSRLTYARAKDRSNAKTARGILNGRRYEAYSNAEKRLIEEATEEYLQGFGKNIFIVEGVGDISVDEIRAETEKHIRLTGKAPVVVVDYVQILAPHNPRWTDKQNMDKTAIELKRLSRDIKMPIFAVSSKNRNSYDNEEPSLADFKESGAIEYGADVAMSLKWDEYNEATGTGKITLHVLKNRFYKPEKVTLSFDPRFNSFSEEEEDKENGGAKIFEQAPVKSPDPFQTGIFDPKKFPKK